MTIFVFLIIATCFLAYSNGANDNSKGVATLYGSETTSYKTAISWATLTTFAGSVSSIFLAAELVKRFSGKGLVPDTLAGTPEFLLAVAIGAGITVILATVIGFPISTTHALTGALVGGGFAAVGSQVNLEVLGTAFFLPLVASPLMAVILAAGVYYFFRFSRKKLGVTKETYVSIQETETASASVSPDAAVAFQSAKVITAAVSESEAASKMRYEGKVVGIGAQKLLDVLHFLSAGVVSFARGLNDTPKIVGLLIAVQALQMEYGLAAIGVAMALGGLINSRKVADTMSQKITTMNPGQGFSANLVTGFLVIFASRLGFPVSTTHVSVGALFGIGSVTGQMDKSVVRKIFMSWILTLPIAAGIAAFVFWMI